MDNVHTVNEFKLHIIFFCITYETEVLVDCRSEESQT